MLPTPQNHATPHQLASATPPPTLSIVVPLLNEAENLEPLLDRLHATLAPLAIPHEIIFVDDGSTDQSPTILTQLAENHPQIRVITLTRNFGHQIALLAGCDAARGEATIMLDADLQHPPELIPTLLEQWRAGYDVVQTIRRRPADPNPLKATTSRLFYRTLSALARIQVTPGAADFRLLSRPALDAFCACRERARLNRGLVQWIGFSYCEVPYDAAPRTAGASKYSLPRMLRLAADAIFSFSAWPLRLAGLAGACISLAAAAYLAFVLFAYFFTNATEPGWSSTLATLLILGGMQLVVLWILGEYVGRMYDEIKQRPLYITKPNPRHTHPDSTKPRHD